MIVFDLHCRTGGETFEAWFGSGADFDGQSAQGLVLCPFCGSSDIHKAPMAPSVPRKGNAERPLERLARAQARMLEKSRWVGDDFATHARAIHCGEADAEPVHGRTTTADARSLVEDGIPVAPLPFPVVPPSQVN